MTLTAITKSIVEKLYRAAAGGDLEAMVMAFSGDVTIEEPPYLPYGGTHRGLDRVLGVFAQAGQVCDLSTLTLKTLTVEDDRAFGVLHMKLHSGEQVIVTEEWTVRGGKIVHGRISWFNPPKI